MERLRGFIYGNAKPSKKPLVRDSKGRSLYLTKLPFYKKYPLWFILGGGTLSALIVYSGTIYHALFTKVEDHPPEYFMWPRERNTGITNVERVREACRKRRKVPQEEVSSQ